MHLGIDCTCDSQSLGDWGDVLTSALTAGSQVYGTQQSLKLQQAMASAQRAAELAAAQRQRAALPPMPADGYSVQLERDALPQWAVPAAIGAGALLLVLLLRR